MLFAIDIGNTAGQVDRLCSCAIDREDEAPWALLIKLQETPLTFPETDVWLMISAVL